MFNLFKPSAGRGLLTQTHGFIRPRSAPCDGGREKLFPGISASGLSRDLPWNALHRLLFSFLLISSLELFFHPVTAQAQANTFALTGAMSDVRVSHTATLLQDGKVLVTGGYVVVGGTPTTLASAELYDPVTGIFTALPHSMTTARMWHTATLLPSSGKVLIAGGYNDAYGLVILSSAEIYDPVNQDFTATTYQMTDARGVHTATLLPNTNGKVLLAGGYNNSSGTLASAEVYEPTFQTFTLTTYPMTAPRGYHKETALADGTVLITGGIGGSSIVASAEVYDPAMNSFAATDPMDAARYLHTATLLPNNTVLVAGGNDYTLAVQGPSAELYDPLTKTFSPAGLMGPMSSVRWAHTATLMPNNNGRVLLAGGIHIDYFLDYNYFLSTAELYDWTTDIFVPTGSMSTHRYLSTATLLLPGDTVLVAGGDRGSGAVSSAELYGGTTAAVQKINNALATIAASPNSKFSSLGHKNSLNNFLTQALGHVALGNLTQAKTKLLTAIERTDGCVLGRGVDQGVGYVKDWITDCPLQTMVYPGLLAAYNAL